MSHIIRFHVEGLAGKKGGFGFTLNRDINLFFGLNGSGKTSLLRILSAAMKNDVSQLRTVAFDRAEVLIHSNTYQADYLYTLDRNITTVSTVSAQLVLSNITGMPTEVEEREAPSWKITPAPPSEFKGTWSHIFLPITRLIPVMRAPTVTELTYEKIFSDRLERSWSDFFGKVLSKVRNIQQSGIVNILTEIISTEPSGSINPDANWEVAYNRTKAFLERQGPSAPSIPKETFERRFKQNVVLRKVVELIDDIEDKITSELQPKTKLQELISRLYSGNKRLLLKDTEIELKTKDDRALSLELLSSGEKQLLLILFDALKAGGSSLIIDEPELSLHIDWQRQLVKSILELNPEVQLIAATHSPEVMGDIDDSKIFRIPA